MPEQQIIIQTRPIAVKPKTAAKLIDVSPTEMNRMMDRGDVIWSQPRGPGTVKRVIVKSLDDWLQKGIRNVA